jgi:Flp pilus assembly pilin Flp
MAELVAAVQRFWSKDRGASLLEHAVLLALIAAACAAALGVFGSSFSNLFSTAATTI